MTKIFIVYGNNDGIREAYLSKNERDNRFFYLVDKSTENNNKNTYWRDEIKIEIRLPFCPHINNVCRLDCIYHKTGIHNIKEHYCKFKSKEKFLWSD